MNLVSYHYYKKPSCVIILVLFIFYGCSIHLNNYIIPHRNALNVPENLIKVLHDNPIDNLPTLVKYLIIGISEDYEKVKSLHDWIAINIKYDIEAQLRQKPINNNLDFIIINKLAVCSGYAILFKEMCSIAGIKCEIIEGYVKTNLASSDNELIIATIPNHQWNAVYLDGNWYLIDVTWDAGYILNKTFFQRYSADYLYALPKNFIKTHYPKNDFWQLLDEPIKWHKFIVGNSY